MNEVPHYQERGKGPAVIFLHGIGGSARVWTLQLAALAESGYRAVAWDSPGYGDSPQSPPKSWDELSSALLALLDCLDLPVAALVGHSFGGMVAQKFVAEHPARVNALVLSGTTAALGRPDGDWQRRFIQERLGPLDEGRSMQDLAPTIVDSLVGPDSDAAGLAMAVEAMGQCPAATYRNSMELLLSFDQRESLKTIGVPTLVLAGENDTNAPAPVMERMAHRIADSVFETISGAGHLANLERPDAFNAAVVGFLKRSLS